MTNILIIGIILLIVGLSSLIFKLSAALLEPITDKRITNSIAAAGESLILIMSCVVLCKFNVFCSHINNDISRKICCGRIRYGILK